MWGKRCGLAGGVEDLLRALASLPEAGVLGLMHHIGVPWEIIALMVPHLQPHARKVWTIVEDVGAERISSDHL